MVKTLDITLSKKETTLNKLRPGNSGTVRFVNGSGAVRRRLFDMGLTPGVMVSVRKVAPFGDPIEITLRGYELTLRKSEAETVQLVLN